jgi:hypothetical protein
MFRFLGRVMGACLRSNSPIDLDLPSLVWRPLVGEASTEADIAAIDQGAYRSPGALAPLLGKTGE